MKGNYIDDRYTYAPQVMGAIAQQFEQFRHDPLQKTFWHRYLVQQQLFKEQLTQSYYQEQQIAQWLTLEAIEQIEQESEWQQEVAQQLVQDKQADEQELEYQQILDQVKRNTPTEIQPTPAEQEAELKRLREAQRRQVYTDPNYNDTSRLHRALLNSIVRLAKRSLDLQAQLARSALLMVVSEDEEQLVFNDITPDNPACFAFDGYDGVDLMVTRLPTGQLAVLSPHQERFDDKRFWQQALTVLSSLGVKQCERMGDHVTFEQMPPQPSAPDFDEEQDDKAKADISAFSSPRPSFNSARTDDQVWDDPRPSAPSFSEEDVTPHPSAPPTDEELIEQERQFLASAPILDELAQQGFISMSDRANYDLQQMHYRYNNLAQSEPDENSNYEYSPDPQ